MVALRQLVKKRLEVQVGMALGFVDVEKVYNTVPRQMVMAMLRWMGVPETQKLGWSWDVWEFSVNIDLRQGSAVSPLMLIMVMDMVSRKGELQG